MSDNLKWLLLIPVVIVAIALGYLIPKLVGGDDSESPANQQENQALTADIASAEESVQAYQGLIDRNASDLEALRGIADTYRDLGILQSENNQANEAFVSFKGAVDNYRKYLATKPDDVEVKIDLGLTYFYLQMVEIAARELKAVTEIAPGNQRAWHSYGWVLENGLGKTDEAKVAWEKSYQLNPNTPAGQESKQFLDQLSGLGQTTPVP